MNILFICDFPFRNTGGVGRVTQTLAKEFVKRNINVAFLSLSRGVDYQSDGIKQYFSPNCNIYSKDNIYHLQKYLKMENIDIIINQGGIKKDILKTIVAAKQEKTRIISVHHGCVRCHQDCYEHIVRENVKNRYISLLMRNKIVVKSLKKWSRWKSGRNYGFSIHHSDKFILLSDGYIRELELFTKRIDRLKLAIIPNPIPYEIENNSQRQKEKRLLFVGRINYSEKRADLLVELWRRIYCDFNDWIFDIVGDGPKLGDLKKKVLSLKIPRIVFHGHRDPRPFLEKAGIFCLTSAFEAFGLVLAEAQAFGAVPMAFDVSRGISDIVQNGINGILIKPYDMDAYERELRALMNNQKKMEELSEAGYCSVAKYEKGHIAERWQRMFQEIWK